MKILTEKERTQWISENVPMMIHNKFMDKFSEIKDSTDALRVDVLRRTLVRVKEDELYSEHHTKQMLKHERSGR